MACMLFIQSPQKHNQRPFTGIYRKYSVLLNAANEKNKKSKSERKVSKKQLIEESDDMMMK